MRRSPNKHVKILLSILMIIGLLSGYFFLFMNPRRGTVKSFEPSQKLVESFSRLQAEEDLQFLFDHLQSRHPAWVDGSENLTQAVTDQYEIEKNQLGDDQTTVELWQAAGRILSKLQDGHTWVNWRNPEQRLYINDFTQIQSYGHPLSINGLSTDEVLEKYLSQSSYELLFYAEERFFQRALVAQDLLTWSGVDTSEGVDMTFMTEDGETTFHYSFVPLEEVKGYEPSNQNEDWVSYSIDPDRDLGVFTLKTCTINDEYKAVLQAFFDDVFENNISNIVVDLRNNGGGNSRVANEFLKYIDVETYNTWDSAIRYQWYLHKNNGVVVRNQKNPETFDGDIYVMINTFTYSSAMDFAMLISDNRLGVLVGSASGNLPDSYGDILYFQLPHSKLVMGVSYKRWYRVDKSKTGLPLTPDYIVPANEALDKVYELIEDN